jgi:hypothetical protein
LMGAKHHQRQFWGDRACVSPWPIWLVCDSIGSVPISINYFKSITYLLFWSFLSSWSIRFGFISNRQ